MAAGTLVSSGSSGNMPTGSGSERLCRATIHALNDDTQEILSGSPGHIYTILSIIFTDQNNSAGGIKIIMNDGTNDIVLLGRNTKVGGYQTFVFSDKFVLEEDDDLKVYNATGNGDWLVSYIDQDFS